VANLSAGKLWGMRRLADPAGRLKMIAIDQRTPLMEPIARKRGSAEAAYDDIAAVKVALTRHLSPHATAMLMDPNYAYPRCAGEMSTATGLCLSAEHHVTRDEGRGRLSSTIPSWGVRQIRRIGGDAVKLLVWYRPDAHESVREHQQAFVRRIGQECREHDIVLLLELLVYPLPGEAPGFVAANRRRLVLDSMRDFAAPGYGVDIYKLEPPAVLRDVPDPDGPQAGTTQRIYDELGALATRPWVLLSAAAGPADFQRSLTYALRAGASGYLCGRAIWQDAFEHFPDLLAMERELATGSVRYVQSLNGLTDRLAVPWQRHPAWRGGVAMAGDGPDFAAGYAPG
jgi:tagatose 1,6-diphosphate aldolase